jgi:peptide/nickel transport system permease protein
VTKEILARFPATLELAGAAIALVILFALPAGILAALYRRAATDHLMRLIAILGASLPGFWLGLLLIYFFAVKLKLLPVTGRGGLEHLILPAVTLSFGMAATYARLLRASMLEVLGQDYITVAWAKGLNKREIVLRHALKNALMTPVTMLGLSFGHLLGGTVIIETVFAWPGVGKFCLEAIFNRDYQVVQAYALFMALVFVLANLLVDLAYRILDARVEVEES